MANYSTLKNAIGAYMTRALGTFVVGSEDMLLRAVNNAKNYCQRAVDFEKAREFAELSINLSGGGILSNATRLSSGNPIIIKSIEHAFIVDPGSAIEIPIEIVSRDSYVAKLKRRYDQPSSVQEATINASFNTDSRIQFVQYGNLIYLSPNAPSIFGGLQNITARFDILEWLPDFYTIPYTGTATSTSPNQLVDSTATFIGSGIGIGDVVRNINTSSRAIITALVSDSTLQLSADIFTSGDVWRAEVIDPTQTNFLIDFCFDFMLFRSIYELNFFLKEDVRVPVSEKTLLDIWNNVVMWNATIVANSTNDATLD